jgi:hypothetical protein
MAKTKEAAGADTKLYKIVSFVERDNGRAWTKGTVVDADSLGDAERVQSLLDDRSIVEFIENVGAAGAPPRSLAEAEAEIQALKARVAELEAENALLRKAAEFVNPFDGVPGIGEEIARALIEKGINSVDELDSSTDETLLAVPGIGQKILNGIRERSQE